MDHEADCPRSRTGICWRCSNINLDSLFTPLFCFSPRELLVALQRQFRATGVSSKHQSHFTYLMKYLKRTRAYCGLVGKCKGREMGAVPSDHQARGHETTVSEPLGEWGYRVFTIYIYSQASLRNGSIYGESSAPAQQWTDGPWLEKGGKNPTSLYEDRNLVQKTLLLCGKIKPQTY